MGVIKVLYIDDEEHNLTSFKASFRRKYEIYTANSAQAAENILSAIPDIHVIISDQRMPQTTGVEFFKHLTQKFPDAIRILLTGYIDVHVLAEAVNEGHIYRYITKPWNELDIINSIQNAYALYKNRAALKEKINELQKANDELNRFIYSLSHELRSPLASALGAIQLARMEDLVPKESKAEEYWDIVEECCNKLDNNITNTLQYYKNNRTDTIYKKVDFDNLVQQLTTMHNHTIQGKETITFTTTINTKADFYNDDFRVEIILSNLISNAVKYQKPDNDNKKINIYIQTDDKQAVIAVQDNGLGIPEGHKDKIFNQFFRGNFEKGSGLGLFILKEALEKLNGTVALETAVDKGSTFTVTIPNIKTAL
ncbi:MAG: ATP-binding protein [Niabella sp.]